MVQLLSKQIIASIDPPMRATIPSLCGNSLLSIVASVASLMEIYSLQVSGGILMKDMELLADLAFKVL